MRCVFEDKSGTMFGHVYFSVYPLLVPSVYFDYIGVIELAEQCSFFVKNVAKKLRRVYVIVGCEFDCKKLSIKGSQFDSE